MAGEFETMWTPNSGNVAHCKYNSATFVLAVTFKDGGQYEYFGVPPETVDAMRKAPSVGKYLHANIKGQFEVRKVGGN